MGARWGVPWLLACGAIAAGCTSILGIGDDYHERATEPLDGGQTVFQHAAGVSKQSCAAEPEVSCAGISCCESPKAPGGTFLVGCEHGEYDYDETPEHAVTVSAFRLDAFEVLRE